MESVLVLDEQAKKRIGIICFIPVLCFLGCLVYYLTLVLPGSGGSHAAGSIVGITSRNYDTLFLMLATSAIITAPVFIYCLVLLARMKTLNAAIKLQWIILLSVLAPIASAFFWVFLIKDARKFTPVHPAL